MIKFVFDQNKAVSAMLFVLNELKQCDFHRFFKILYFADRKHLKRYGTPIIGDEYISMENGPVPSTIYDLLKWSANKQTHFPPNDFHRNFSSCFVIENGYHVKPLLDADCEQLSASERECLSESIVENKDLTFGKLKAKSHDIAWKQPDKQLNTIDFLKMAKAEGADDDALAYISETANNMALF